MMYKNIRCGMLVVLMLVAGYWLPDAGMIFAQQKKADAVAVPGTDTTGITPDVTGDKTLEKPVEMSDIHDIKAPENIGVDLRWLYYVGLGILIAAVLFALFLLFKKYRKRVKQKEFITLSPDELALNLLDKLLDVENINGKAFYFELSAILRNYIQGRYDINAPEMTTEELLPEIEELKIDKELQKQLKALLHSADPVKFANIPAIQSKMQADVLFVIDFVKQTTPAANTETES